MSRETIPDRLREQLGSGTMTHLMDVPADLLREAADEIERLRNVAMHYCKACAVPGKYGMHSCREYR